MTSIPENIEERLLDYLVIGGGPAGLQLAYFLSGLGADYLVLEADRVGSFFRRLPRHRRLISNNKVHTGFSDSDKNLRWDWNSLLSEDLSLLFTEYSDEFFPPADTLVRYLEDYRARFGLSVIEGVRVSRVSRVADPDGRADPVFRVRAEDGRRFLARRVVVASGHTVPHVPDVPGIELAEPYPQIPTDPQDYRGQRVLIVGKGNSGMETAENIFASAASVHLLSPSPVRLAWTTHHVSDVRATYHNTLDSYQLKMQHTILDASLDRMVRQPDGRIRVDFTYSHAGAQSWTLVVDRVLLCTGFRFDSGIFDESCALTTTCHGGRWPAMTSGWESVDVPGLFFAGTVMQARDYKKSFSGFIHGFRYTIRLLSQLLGERYHDRPQQSVPVGADPEALTEDVVRRADDASSLFQLPGLMADVYLLDEPGGTVPCYRDTTVDLALDHPDWRDRTLLVVTLEYGHLPAGADPFNFRRDPLDGSTSQFIHPLLRLYVGGVLVDTYHVPEDLENEWHKEMYVLPCREAVARMLVAARGVVTAS